jgi:LytS/YehU family sensor histidine kinase
MMSSFLLVYLALHYARLYKEKKLNEAYTESLLMARDHAEIEALKLQLDPHFLFNSLNTLHHLILPGNLEARKYVQLLADVYRYILKNRSRELVLLQEELNFSQQYFHLLRIRYGDGIQLCMEIESLKAQDYLVVPISIQILIENAIKHNRFTPEEPLELLVGMNAGSIAVQNKLKEDNKIESLKIGLNNLSERCLKVTNKPLTIDSSEGQFTARLPLIKFK